METRTVTRLIREGRGTQGRIIKGSTDNETQVKIRRQQQKRQEKQEQSVKHRKHKGRREA